MLRHNLANMGMKERSLKNRRMEVLVFVYITYVLLTMGVMIYTSAFLIIPPMHRNLPHFPMLWIRIHIQTWGMGDHLNSITIRPARWVFLMIMGLELRERVSKETIIWINRFVQ